MEEFRSYLHEHPLKLQVDTSGGAQHCSMCKNPLQGEVYVCNAAAGCSRGFQIHRSCIRLDPRIQHHLHPCPLSLRMAEDTRFCDACFEYIDLSASYSCEDCIFTLDVACSKAPTGQGKGLVHFTHGHPLTKSPLSQPGVLEEEDYLCGICGGTCSGSDDDVVGCKECKFFLHGTCLSMLPQRIRRASLHPCDLILYAPLSKRISTDSGGSKANPNQALMFRCGRCRFNLCMSCWLSPEAVESVCRHPENDTVSRLKCCSACGRICTAPQEKKDGTDGSSLLQPDQSLFLPPQIRHVWHPLRPLPLVDLPKMGIYPMRCNLCLGYSGDHAYLCFQDDCPLLLHPECAFLTPTVMSSDHKHPLTVVERIYGDGIRCSCCHASCSNYSVLRCLVLGCNYTIHIWCGPLPCYIKHSVHVHPLALKDYIVNEEGEDDDENSFCCHSCEEPRDPRLGVYWCEQGCHMICEVQCVASEVIATLRGQRGDEVELRIVGKIYQRACKIITNVDLFKEMNMRDVGVEEGNAFPGMSFRQLLSCVGYHGDRRRRDHLPSHSAGSRPSESSADFVLSEEAFGQLISRLESHDITDDTAPDRLVREWAGLGMESSDEDPEAIRSVFEYWPNAIHSIIRASIGQEAKIPSIAFVSEVLEGLITTKVVDVNEEKLLEWWGYLNWIKRAGVDIDFMFDPLKRVSRAYFGLRARSLVAEKDRELEEISKEIDRLRKKAEAVKNQRDICRMSMRNSSAFVKQCLRDGKRLRWKPAIKVLDEL